MSGGSEEPERALDKQCPHCGLYYMDRGNSFDMHKMNCDGAEAVEEPDNDTDPRAGEHEGDPNEEPDTADEGGSNPLHDGPDVDPPTHDHPQEVRDGCPNCGAELVDYRDHETVTRGGVMYDTPYDYACHECETTYEYSED